MNGEYPAIFLNGHNVHVHRLEWMKYNGQIPDGYIIHHKDENKLNWHIDNLEILKRSDHILKHQKTLRGDNFVKYGEESRNHKLTIDQVRYIKHHYKKYDKHFGGRALANKFNVTEQCVCRIVKEFIWKGVV